MSKNALVVGIDSSNIVAHVAASLADSGYDVTGVAEAYQPSTSFHDALARVLYADLSSLEETTALVEQLRDKSYEVVIHGVSALAQTSTGELRNEGSDFDLVQFNRVLQRTVTSAAAISLGLKDNIASRGCVVYITSSAARDGAFATPAYNASKAAIHNLTKSLANVLGSSRGIRVNCVAPGWIPPNPAAAGAGIVALADALTPSHLIGETEHVVQAVRYLIENEFQNASVLDVDGGIASSYLPYMLESLELDNRHGDSLERLVDALKEAKKRLKRV